MRLEKIQQYLKEKNIPYRYAEPSGLGSVDFDYRGLKFHVWEFLDGDYGVESNVNNVSRFEDFTGNDYEEEILRVLRTW